MVTESKAFSVDLNILQNEATFCASVFTERGNRVKGIILNVCTWSSLLCASVQQLSPKLCVSMNIGCVISLKPPCCSLQNEFIALIVTHYLPVVFSP